IAHHHEHRAAFRAGAAHGLLPKAASSAMFAFWRQLTSRLRYNHASIAKVSLLLTSTTCAVVATRADTCPTSNSIMSSLSVIFIAPVISTSFFMVLLLLDYGMLVAHILILFFLSEIGSGPYPLHPVIGGRVPVGISAVLSMGPRIQTGYLS